MTKGKFKMTDKKNYLVSDLASELGVPRTTLNDWLKRYDRYLPSEITGRRRTYTAAALEVLVFVNKMRNDGLSANKIEVELEKIFAVRPDEVVESEQETTAQPPVGTEDEKNDGAEPSLPALRREEYERFLGTVEDFSRMEKVRRRSALYVWTVILLIAAFSLSTAWYMARLVKLQAAGNMRLAAIQKENAAARDAMAAADRAGKKAISSQNKEISELKKSIVSNSAKEQAEREKESLRSRKSLEEMQKLILTLQREQNSFKEKLEKDYERRLQEKNTVIKQNEISRKAAAGKLREREKEIVSLKKETEKLRRELAAMKKSLSAAEDKNKPVFKPEEQAQKAPQTEK